MLNKRANTKGHSGLLYRGSFLVFILLVLGAVMPATSLFGNDDEAGVVGQYTDESADSCLSCHDADDEHDATAILSTPHAVATDGNSPFGSENHACESCHGPSKSHLTRLEDGSRPEVDFEFETGFAVEDQNQVCLGCHQDATRFHWPGSTHESEEVACVDCHDIHTVNDPVLSLETQSDVCLDCHSEQRSQFLRQSRHPVQSSTAASSHQGLMSCTDCHNPHGSSSQAMLVRNSVNETCYDCHAEKRGPFLWEHAPVREDCTNCHTPHGANYDNLLIARQPWLCQQCHSAGFHPSGVYSGLGIPPNGADQRILGKQCLNCHTQVHGSNHPSGIRLTR